MIENAGKIIVTLAVDPEQLKKGLKEGKLQLDNFKGQATNFASGLKKTLALVGLGAGLYQLGGLIKRTFTDGIKAVDEFRLTTIGVASTMADMADEGVSTQDAYNQSLAYAQDMYNELELAAAKFFASGTDLVQAWNIMAQKGVVLRKEEINNLGVIVDKIKLLTSGQMASIQIAQEMRAALTGQARVTDQMAKLLLDKLGPGWKKVLDEVRKTGSLKPLAEQFQGLAYAGKDIQNTLESQSSTMGTLLKQIGRGGLTDAYEDIVGLAQDINEYLRENKNDIIAGIKRGWEAIRDLVEGVYNFVKLIHNYVIKPVTWTINIVFTGAVKLAEWLAASKGMQDLSDVIGGIDMTPRDDKGEVAAAKRAAAQRGLEGMGAAFGGDWAGPEPPKMKPMRPEDEGKKGGGGKAKATDALYQAFIRSQEAYYKWLFNQYQIDFEKFKAGQNLKKAQLELDLELNKISGMEYYDALNAMEEENYRRTQDLNEKKRQAAAKELELKLAEIKKQQELGKLTEDTAELERKTVISQHNLKLQELEADEAKTTADHKTRLIDLLRKEADNRRDIADTIAQAEEAGAFTEAERHEARINALLREQAKARDELIQKGATQAEVAALASAQQRQVTIAESGEDINRAADTIARGISSITESLVEGGGDLKAGIESLFKDLFKSALEPGFKQLTSFLQNALDKVFSKLGSGFGGAVMGAIALAGMMLFRGGSSSATPAGVQSAVTGHEAVRGIVAGPTSIPIAEIGESLGDALIPTNDILAQIEANTRAGGLQNIRLEVTGLEDALKEALESVLPEYFTQQMMVS